MSHAIREKKKLLARMRRIRGQVEAIERALDSKAGCEQVMQLIADVGGIDESANKHVAESKPCKFWRHICHFTGEKPLHVLARR